jgi:hypothetical protein
VVAWTISVFEALPAWVMKSFITNRGKPLLDLSDVNSHDRISSSKKNERDLTEMKKAERSFKPLSLIISAILLRSLLVYATLLNHVVRAI